MPAPPPAAGEPPEGAPGGVAQGSPDGRIEAPRGRSTGPVDGADTAEAAVGDDGLAVLVPVKAFARAKARLAGALDPAARAALVRRMATGVVAAAAPLPVGVVCDDDEVAAWAASVGARVLWRPGRGLDAAVADGVAAWAELGARRVVVAHADLPRARHLAWVADFDGVTLVPDRHDDGTNVCCVPAAGGFRFSYGAGSFVRHRAEAVRLGLALRVVRDPDLGWDVDHPDDLRLPGLLPAPTTPR